MTKGTKLFFFLIVFAFFILEAMFPFPHGKLLVLASFTLYLFISSLSFASSVHGLRSYKTWIYAITSGTLPFAAIYLLCTLFPKAFSSSYGNVWDYCLIAFYMFGGFWYLRMDKKDNSIVRKTSIAYYLFGLMLLSINVGMYFEEDRSFQYIVLSIIVLTVLISVFSIRYRRSKERNTQPTSVLP